jgi:CHAT domain-containing protein/tetratricopeptide (TPR) repeat protein
MKIEASIEQFIGEFLPPQILAQPLSDKVADIVVNRLKQEADRYWYIDPRRSLEFANRIIAIGRQQGNNSHIALGLMAQGDALKLLGRTAEAWEALSDSGNIYQSMGDEVGWARTRIGRLYLSTMLNCVPEALSDGERARTIFTDHEEYEKLLRLDINTALLYTLLGDQHEALRLYHSALATAETLGEAGEQYIAALYTDIGLAHESLGSFSQALAYYERARERYVARKETLYIAISELNIAYIAQAQGYYRRALQMLYKILESGVEQFPVEYRAVKRDMTECFLYLNRYSEARDLAYQNVTEYKSLSATHDMARNLLHLATAEAELNNFGAAQSALDEAEPIFASLGAQAWVATTRLWRGQIALKQGDSKTAYYAALASGNWFKEKGQQFKYATAILLQGQAQLALGEIHLAGEAAGQCLLIAQQYNIPSLRYAAHLLLAKIAESQRQVQRAIRRYQAAAATVERVQRGLTLTLRPGFLEDKGEASRNLIALYLHANQAEHAFDALERDKSQVLLSYLANREQFRWGQDEPQNKPLLEELNRLRGEHQWYYRLAHEPPGTDEHPKSIDPGQARAEVALRERRIRSLTEQLYLNTRLGSRYQKVETTSLQDVQETLMSDTVLIEFYNDGSHYWAFAIDRQSCRVHALPVTVDALNHLLAQLKGNIAAVLTMDPHSLGAHNLTQLACRILKRLYSLLLEPLQLEQYQARKLVFVPYGSLHYLPFNLLHDGSTYLVEKYNIVILPAAGLATRPAPERKPGALILANSWEGRLPHTLAEAQIVQALFGGSLHTGESARREILQTPPTKILHIATHGEHRLDQPDLSYLQLSDGQLYADDILQQDMSYELVTLSACETGRMNVAASEELIGLGRGFLYAGAGALLVSLWQVADTSTLNFMEYMYRALYRGVSKSAAIREAQHFLLYEDASLHPAFWGAFQLIGNDRPLSSVQ